MRTANSVRANCDIAGMSTCLFFHRGYGESPSSTIPSTGHSILFRFRLELISLVCLYFVVSYYFFSLFSSTVSQLCVETIFNMRDSTFRDFCSVELVYVLYAATSLRAGCVLLHGHCGGGRQRLLYISVFVQLYASFFFFPMCIFREILPLYGNFRRLPLLTRQSDV